MAIAVKIINYASTWNPMSQSLAEHNGISIGGQCSKLIIQYNLLYPFLFVGLRQQV